MPVPSVHRRSLLKGAAAALSLTAIRASGMQRFAAAPPYRVALIGSGWYGKSDLFKLIQVAPVDVVALADVDKNMLAEAAGLVAQRQASKKEPKQYTDYRKLLQETKPDIVLIGSPDHWHALQAIDAIKAGAHVYLQKPISVDVLEGEAILAAARNYNRVVQIGTQRRSTPHLVEAKEKIIDSGMLGKVHHVDMCCYYHMRNGSNPSVQPVPAHLDYDAWTGPAPLRPFDGMPHRGWWRAFMEYGNGIVGDMCVHMFDATRWMLGLGWPKSITSHGGIYVDKAAKSNTSDTQHAVFAYDDLNCVWQHRSWGPPADPEYPWAYILYGEKGTLKCSVFKYEFIPNEKGEKLTGTPLFEKEKYPEDLKEKDIELHTASATRRHMRNFINAIEKGGRPVADVAEGHISTASCILANISMKLGGRPLVYDPVKKVVVNDAEATALLARKYRDGYTHPFKAIS
ncbi:Predicted dehydrogenase [Cnuella takakiae]|uniref:Predicted dehydrogenase n=1 Tax=Cnuella takakiae TaxID=1302690 RepID=A0A1M5BSW8_9BACT|nr:Gfo/Idh/MocA family oxidoreductase [Cnuella takakiae]OLY93506.1 oxidoreductase [Cnuella takakiae]SHF45664.1 Predicted dehydrogenase [Cnuella takakiae]